MQYEHVTVPAEGGTIRINADRTLSVPDEPIIPFIEGDGIGIDVTPAMQRVVDAAVTAAYGARRRIHWMEVYSGREGDPALRAVLPRRDTACAARVRGLDQGAAGDAGRRRHAFAERGDAAEPGPVCLRAPDPLLPRGRQPDAGCEPHRHGGVPREHRGHLRRDRVAGRLGRGAAADRLPADPAARDRHPLPGQLRHRHQAGLEGGQPAADPQGHPVRHRARPRLGDAGAQGQHHEVHGRGLPQLGLPAGEGGVRRDGRSATARGCRSGTR